MNRRCCCRTRFLARMLVLWKNHFGIAGNSGIPVFRYSGSSGNSGNPLQFATYKEVCLLRSSFEQKKPA